MSANSVTGVLKYIRTLVAGHKADGQPDQYLVEQFVLQGDETAFAALLERHGPMVLGVCRRMLHDEQLTEDAFQATFLVLARKAGSLRKRESVASYLHSVALNMSRKIRSEAARFRQPVPPEAAPVPESVVKQASWREEEGILDQELQRLPERYRLPLLLCYLEGRTRDEAAQQLGWTTGKLRGLLDRGREQLRGQLSRRGVTLTAAGCAILITDSMLSASVPPLLSVATMKAAVNYAAGKSLAGCGVSPAVAALVEAGLLIGPRKMLLMGMLIFIITSVVLGMAFSGTRGGNGPFHRVSQPAPPLAKPGQQRPAAAKPPVENPARPTADRPKVEPPVDGAMTFHFTNNTGGKFRDDQIFWAILGNGPHHLSPTGQLVRMNPADNSAAGHLTRNGAQYANYFHSLAEARSVVVPKMSSGRVYLSVGSPMYLRVDRDGYRSPDISDPADPNADVIFDFVEFNFGRIFHGSTTQVDAFGLPLMIELLDEAGVTKQAGIRQSRTALFAAFKREAPAQFASCVKEPYRIVAPRNADFAAGKPQAGYFDDYLDEVWETFAAPTRIAGGYTGQVKNGALVFTHDSGKAHTLARKPTTQEVFDGGGVLRTEPQFCAAIHRHVLAQPADWNQAKKYYQAGPANYYAKFWHDHSLNGKACGFSYDNVNRQEGFVESARPRTLNVTISW